MTWWQWLIIWLLLALALAGTIGLVIRRADEEEGTE